MFRSERGIDGPTEMVVTAHVLWLFGCTGWKHQSHSAYYITYSYFVFVTV